VDRLDYTKGLPERLHGFERFLQQNPKYHKRVTSVQIAVPSRTRVPEYRALTREVEELVASIVTRFSIEGWLPIRYVYKQYDPEVLVAYYLAADIGLVTPLDKRRPGAHPFRKQASWSLVVPTNGPDAGVQSRP
jgi:trehalose-6-phosphate synthase